MALDVRVLDLDGGLLAQTELLGRVQRNIYDLRNWGPALRLACGFRRFGQFREALDRALSSTCDIEPTLSFVGSGDFHHVSLALLHRINQPFNILILDNHPDWMRGIPFLHCGTWVRHAARLPNLRTIFHVGGDVDFDNSFRFLAPWPELRSGKIRVISAIRCFERGTWADCPVPTVRHQPDLEASPGRVQRLVDTFQNELKRWPLYISLDKDVMTSQDAVVNWDSGHLTLAEVQTVLAAFVGAADRRLAGMDVVGDWSPVRLRGLGRRILHLTEHPRLTSTPEFATARNQQVNLRLVRYVADWTAKMPAATEEYQSTVGNESSAVV
jgi:hypothetical protein